MCRSPIDRELLFWSKVNKSGRAEAPHCWDWTGSRMPNGYSVANVEGWRTGTFYAHRIAYELTIEPIGPGLELDHLCRNRWCVNPAHLEPVTKRENIRRGRAGCNHRDKTHCKRGHGFTPETTAVFTTKRADGTMGSHRQCVLCRREVSGARQRLRRAEAKLHSK